MEGVAAIVHLAAVFRTPNEDDIWRANLEGTRNLIAAAKAYIPHSRFVMASTGLVYDEDAPHPGIEEDAVHPKRAYPASKVAAENELRSSGLNWSILRLPFVYRDGDGHLASVPRVIATMKWHPARTFSLAHQRDVAKAFELALTGTMDGLIVDHAPATLYEMASIARASIESSAEPLTNPWMAAWTVRGVEASVSGRQFKPCTRLLKKGSCKPGRYRLRRMDRREWPPSS